jgi:hypothetical protein
MNVKLVQTSTYAGLFFLSLAIGYALSPMIFSLTRSTPGSHISARTTPSVIPTKAPAGTLVFEGPQTEICPLNGTKHTQEERKIWEQRRPLAVMIENSLDSRPQSGLSNADIVYEGMSEGGITRFMGVYYCQALRGAEEKYDVGPVRSARIYFANMASEYADYPLYTHVGGANCSAATPGGPCTTAKKVQAIEALASWGWNNKGTWGDLSQFSLPYKVCRREYERTGEVKDTEHTMYCSTEELWNTAATRGLTNITQATGKSWDKNFTPWKFDQIDQSQGDGSLSYGFWKGYTDYDVSWKYDSKDNQYLRSNGGSEHKDFNTDETLAAKNIVIMQVKEERSLDGHAHNYYEVVGSGKGFLYQNGTQTEITWSKASRTSRTVFKLKSGKEVDFVPGQIWVVLLPSQNTPTYESSKQQ